MSSNGLTLDQASVEEVPSYPGQPAMWFFVIGDLWIFACYFACYMYDRGQSQDLFLLGQQSLSSGIGVINTILLLTSSLFVAFCVKKANLNEIKIAKYLLMLGGACGVSFLLIKAYEWNSKLTMGLPNGASEFFIYYFMFTGLHFLHVLFGLLILTLVYRELSMKNLPRAEFVEAGAIYWHMVDLLWIVIFALLYLIR